MMLLTGVWLKSQRYDIYQNEFYEVSTYVLEHYSDKEHQMGEIRIYQDKNKTENPVWTKIQNDLYNIAIHKIDDEFEYFKILNSVNFKREQAAELNRMRNQEEPGKLRFEGIKIKLISILNGIGTYSVNYNFEAPNARNSYYTISESYFFLANYKTGNLTEISKKPDQKQLESLKRLSSSKFKKLYLLQTKKLQIKEIDRILGLKTDNDDDSDFLDKIDFSEAYVFPFFNGLMIEFPAYSFSSKIFDGYSFRVLLEESETKELLKVYPEFKTVFSANLKTPTPQTIELLNDENKFGIQLYPPKELDLLKVLKPGKNIKVMKTKNGRKTDLEIINNYHKYFYFNQNQKLDSILIQQQDQIKPIERYFYDKNGQLEAVYRKPFSEEMELYYYSNGTESGSEKIEISEYRDALSNEYLNLSVVRSCTAFNGPYKYSQQFEMVGRPKYEDRYLIKYIDGNNLCTNYGCALYDENGKLLGVNYKSSGGFLSFLVNENNQPLEIYKDNDKYFFEYDRQGRITNYLSISSNGTKTAVYEYFENPEFPLIITETDRDSKSVTEYHFEFE